jgi:transmembrane sensor
MSSRADEAWKNWMAADVEHEMAYETRDLAWELAAELETRPRIQQMLGNVDEMLRGRRAAAAHAAHRGPRLFWQAGLLASVLAVAVVTYLRLNRVTISEYATVIGEQRVVTLADNSTVSLNTDTRLRVLYSRAARRIELFQGEALFSVSHNTKRPFEVRALRGVTTAVGTQFDVQISGDAAAVTVLEGTVKVEANEGADTGEPLPVSAGQAVEYTRTGVVSPIRPADAVKIRGWQSQRIVFRDMEVGEALREYNRYSKIPIVLATPALATRHINGVFRIGDTNAFLGALQQGLHVKAVTTDSQIVLSKP